MSKEILRFESVTLPDTEEYSGAAHNVDFVLCAGEALLIDTHDTQGWPPLADTAEGLLPPRSGAVRIGGAEWSTLNPDASTDWRSRIGRVFADHAWVSNLDVDENVTLAQRHHARQAPAEISEQAQTWARRFGLDALPATRPAWTPRKEQMLAQWVRALLGEPALLILENPTRDVPGDASEHLLNAVREQRDRGAAVIWMTTEKDLQNHASLEPTYRATLSKDRWEIES